MDIRQISALPLIFLISLSYCACDSAKKAQNHLPEASLPVVGSKTIINLPAPEAAKAFGKKRAKASAALISPSSASASLPSEIPSQALSSLGSESRTGCEGEQCAQAEKDTNDCGGCDNEQICDPSIDCDRSFCTHPRCCVNSDCPSGEVCIGYDCMPCTTELCGKTCCAPNFTCVNDVCTCPGKVCFGVCDPAAQCCNSVDCPSGSTCQSRRCVRCAGVICTPGTCISGGSCCLNSDCPANSTCNTNQCVACAGRVCSNTCIADATCCTDADCPSNVCTLNQCEPEETSR